MRDFMKELLAEALREGDNVEEFLEEFYNCEYNFNNADPTSGQRCYEYPELEEMMEEILDELQQ